MKKTWLLFFIFSIVVSSNFFYLQSQEDVNKDSLVKSEDNTDLKNKSQENQSKKIGNDTKDVKEEDLPIFYANENDNATKENQESQSYGSINYLSYFSLIFALLLVIAGIYGLLYLLKKFNLNKLLTNSDNYKSLDVFPLIGGKYLQVVNVYGKYYVLGISEKGISLVSEITDKQTIDKIELEASKNNLSNNFASLISKFGGSKTNLAFKNKENQSGAGAAGGQEKSQDVGHNRNQDETGLEKTRDVVGHDRSQDGAAGQGKNQTDIEREKNQNKVEQNESQDEQNGGVNQNLGQQELNVDEEIVNKPKNQRNRLKDL